MTTSAHAVEHGPEPDCRLVAAFACQQPEADRRGCADGVGKGKIQGLDDLQRPLARACPTDGLQLTAPVRGSDFAETVTLLRIS